MLRVWCDRWEVVAKKHCILDLREDADMFRFHQPVGFHEKYGMCIHCELDGTVTKHDKNRRYSVKARCSYCDKCKWQASQGLTWTTTIGTCVRCNITRVPHGYICVMFNTHCTGLVLLCTTLWCGRTSEKALVRLYRTWLCIFPRSLKRARGHTRGWWWWSDACLPNDDGEGGGGGHMLVCLTMMGRVVVVVTCLSAC